MSAPASFVALGSMAPAGTAEAMPFPNRFMREPLVEIASSKTNTFSTYHQTCP
jgi:hypothetical protein